MDSRPPTERYPLDQGGRGGTKQVDAFTAVVVKEMVVAARRRWGGGVKSGDH